MMVSYIIAGIFLIGFFYVVNKVLSAIGEVVKIIYWSSDK